jgi:hypothetical protein
MKALLCSLVVGLCLAAISAAKTPAQPQAPPTAQTPAAASTSAASPPIAMNFTPGTLIRTALEKPIDTKKAKVGDQVFAKTTDDLKSVPPGLATKGCKIIGHVVEVTPHQGDAASTLRIVFDKMILKNGSDMALPATIKAVGFAEDFNPATDTEIINAMGGNGFGRGLNAGGNGGVVGSGGGDPKVYAGGRLPAGNTGTPGASDAKLPFDAKGAIGMSGTSLSAGTAQDSILTSKKKNVKLDGGMQMILKTD